MLTLTDHIRVAVMAVAFLLSTVLLALAVAVNPVVALMQSKLTKKLSPGSQLSRNLGGVKGMRDTVAENHQSSYYTTNIGIGDPPTTCK